MWVSDIKKRTKTEPKRTKPSTGMERARKTEAEGIPMFYGPTRAHLMGRDSPNPNLSKPDPESLIRRRNLGEPSSLFNFEEVMSIPHNNMGPPPAGPHPPNNNGTPPMVRPNGQAPRSMEELCQPSIDGRAD
ncbi:hypothetical protein Tco_0686088 [Tanacetum coccineum]